MDLNTWWQWKLLALRRNLEQWRRNAHNLWRGVEYSYVMCGECRALVERGTRVCPSCGARRMDDGSALLVDDVLPLLPIKVTSSFVGSQRDFAN